MGQLVLFSPFMLVVGNLTWFVWINDQPLSNFIRITQLVSLVPPLIEFLNPAHIVNRLLAWFKSRPCTSP